MHERPRAESPSRDANLQPIELHPGATVLQSTARHSRLAGLERQRILVLKLDHRGDFLIGLPALEKLRATFPDGHIVLVCGSWNEVTARDVGVADEIRTYDYFPRIRRIGTAKRSKKSPFPTGMSWPVRHSDRSAGR
jgi:hypothetical protein